MSRKKPFFRSAAGVDTELVWTRLLPEEEVGQSAPAAAPPMAQAFGFQEVTEDGVAFGVASDDGIAIVTVQPEVMVTGAGFDQVRRARVPKGVPGPRSPLELDRPWRATEALLASQTAHDLLAAHNHPLEYMHRPIGWAWLGDDLCWAEIPEQGGGLVGLTRAGKSLSLKKKKGPPDAVPISHAKWLVEQDPRYEAAWPAFGAVAWAKRVYQSIETMNYVDNQMEGYGGDAQVAAQLVWNAAFALGSHLTEHRLRSLHGGMLVTGQKNRAATAAGADQTNRARRRVRNAAQDVALDVAAERLAGAPRPGGKPWTVSALAAEIYAGWKAEQAPSISTITRFIREAVNVSDSRVSVLKKADASV